MRPLTQISVRHLSSIHRARSPHPSARSSVLSSAGAPSIRLARLVGRDSSGWRARLDGREQILQCDSSVDPALLDDAIRSGARAVLEGNNPVIIVGLLTTARSVGIDRENTVDVSVKHCKIQAEEILLKSTASFLRLKYDDVELYGSRILARARELTRLLGRMIKLN